MHQRYHGNSYSIVIGGKITKSRYVQLLMKTNQLHIKRKDRTRNHHFSDTQQSSIGAAQFRKRGGLSSKKSDQVRSNMEKVFIVFLGVLFSLILLDNDCTDAADDSVCDKDLPKFKDRCPEFAREGYCNGSAQRWMEHYCRKSCGLPCKPVTTPNTKPPAPVPKAFCRDRDIKCAERKQLGQCGLFKEFCGVTCKSCKVPIGDECNKDAASDCKEREKNKECDSTNPKIEYYMKKNCVGTCKYCELFEIGSGSEP
ncbi:PREDICTED: uncharacterized protein LOC107337756 isoform X3 [Acropora digitifera]|uniref:uncharacterized protein LOC107337756 isoform X3 n=2 Tax=Acropora digitifera TaxID=70779 RepID=UPI00077A2D28|nr:PREDICTED: uncharacterized protein LOC107337756 isoform X3 [Acropora digitifera]